MPRKVEFVPKTKLEVDGIVGFMKRKVVRYGTGAAVICPKEFLGRTAYLVITRETWGEKKEGAEASRGADSRRGRKQKRAVSP
jgi:putative transposon-encoded protein